jgi:phenylpropionate dioxygenase-like ring-hydroxylating dioxygenase large terminal subunit
MRGLLSASHYCNADVFESEQARIFSACWIFAGLHQLVASPDQYFTCHVAGRDVVVQNFDGRIRAFENICRHRGKRIQTAEFGKRKLVCAYHGWRYADDGTGATIPFENECYRLEPNERAALRLPEFALERVGQLLFVSMAESPSPIGHQFDVELLSSLESVSGSFDNEVLVTTIDGRYNWKLAYENLRDSLHPRFVHTQQLNVDVAFVVHD